MKVLFLCTNDTCRSVMANAVFYTLVKNRGIDAECDSAGLAEYGNEAPDQNAIAVMREIGIDISEYRSKNINPGMLSQADFIMVMTEQQKDSLCAFDSSVSNKVKVMNISDPYGHGIEDYRRCMSEIVKYMDRLLEIEDENVHNENA